MRRPNNAFEIGPSPAARAAQRERYASTAKGVGMRKFLFLMFAFSLIGCANPSVVRVKDAELGKLVITKVFVPRFEGNPNFVEESTDLFVTELESRISAHGHPVRIRPDPPPGGTLDAHPQ